MALRADLPPDDGDAVARAATGDAEAFTVLFRRYFPLLVRFLERRGCDHARAEDVAQETLARAYRYLGGFDTARPLWPWLRTIALRVAAADAERRAVELAVGVTPDVATSDPVEGVLGRDALAESLRRLPRRHRDALVMRYVEDRDPSDVAAVLGLSRNSYDQLLWRARRGLAREYAKVSGAVLAPLAVRARRAANWVDTRIGTPFAGLVANAGDAATAAVGAVVVASSLSATVLGAAAPVPSALAGRAPAAVAEAGEAVRPAAAVPRRVAAPRSPAAARGEVVVERAYQAGPATARSRTSVGADPARDGTAHHMDVDTPESHTGAGVTASRTGGDGLICLMTELCDLPRP
ncbi:MAG TPA: sigma-70 family RNA polymerase sigma factor [Mycobacteriales bacterium]|jgi:RNA polymerase sigma-70 factor (ECF subfamily)